MNRLFCIRFSDGRYLSDESMELKCKLLIDAFICEWETAVQLVKYIKDCEVYEVKLHHGREKAEPVRYGRYVN